MTFYSIIIVINLVIIIVINVKNGNGMQNVKLEILYILSKIELSQNKKKLRTRNEKNIYIVYRPIHYTVK